jgi:dienelactone hydrolase
MPRPGRRENGAGRARLVNTARGAEEGFAMSHTRTILDGDLQGVLLTPVRHSGLGVVVLGGSSGKADVERAGLFADHDAMVLAQRWFGGAGQPPAICEIPLETFCQGIDRLAAEGCERIALLGTSRGAEAALLTACFDSRLDAVIAVSPGSVVWPCIYRSAAGDRWIQSSSWTWAGKALSFLPYDEEAYEAMPKDPPVRWLGLFLRSLAGRAASTSMAAIPVEAARADLVLIAGGDDQLWPSVQSAQALENRRTAAGRSVRLVTHAAAGHRILFPGETTPRSALNLHGGTDDADRSLGREAWSAICEVLGLIKG